MASIAIIGALSPLGWSILQHLSKIGGYSIYAIDFTSLTDDNSKYLQGIESVSFLQCDLSDPKSSTSWKPILDKVKILIHVGSSSAAECWASASRAIGSTNNILIAASETSNIERIIYISSTHVMGQYIARGIPTGQLTCKLPPEVGLTWLEGSTSTCTTPHGSEKLTGEHLCETLSNRHPEKIFICLRFGIFNVNQEYFASVNDEIIRTWLQSMWISERDAQQLIENAIKSTCEGWPHSKFVVLNGVSRNSGMSWDIETTQKYLNYNPQDDICSINAIESTSLALKHRKIFITPNDMYMDSFRLAHNILLDGFRPNFLIGIWRGGTPVAIAMEDYFRFKGLKAYHTAIKTQSYEGINKQGKEIHISGLNHVVDVINSEDRLLLCDDVWDSGHSMVRVVETLQKMARKNAPEIRTACLYFKPTKNKTHTKPDYFLHQTDEWLIFPHELEGLDYSEVRMKWTAQISDLLLTGI